MSARPQTDFETHFIPSREECRALLERIGASREFHRAARLRAFLAYVVERRLTGSPDEITETLIGHRVFGRPADYNSGDDSIVRTEARTLRQRLERYFAGEGAAEPVRIEIPRGGYVPVFHLREGSVPAPEPAVSVAGEAIAHKPPMDRRSWLWMGAGALATVTGLRFLQPAHAPEAAEATPASGPSTAVARLSGSPAPAASPGLVRTPALAQFASASLSLNMAFQHAKERAMACVYSGDSVGDWYTSAVNNKGFCMRDVSHESLGASVLGLTRHNANMLRRFAQSVAKGRGWCGYWIINKDGFAPAANYSDDREFGYSLPANFDLVRACYRQFLWTGDRSYLDPVFFNFYDRTVTDYVDAWDNNHDGLMEGDADRPRIHPSYRQGAPRIQTAADLVAAQYAAYLAYAAMQERLGVNGSLSMRLAKEFRAKAQALRARFNSEWWNAAENRFYSAVLPDGIMLADYLEQSNVYALWFGLPQEGPKADAALDALEKNGSAVSSLLSYFPEVLYESGRSDAAYRYLMRISDPAFTESASAEPAFATIGAIATGLMGISPDVPAQTVATLPRLTNELPWARLSRLPVGVNEIAVEHRGVTRSTFTNASGPAIQWKVRFAVTRAASNPRIWVDGAAVAAVVERQANGGAVLSAVVPVTAKQTRTAAVG